MRAWKLAIPSAILSLGFLFCGTATYGKPEYAKKESKKCVDCHVQGPQCLRTVLQGQQSLAGQV
jgi:hypothetical protein